MDSVYTRGEQTPIRLLPLSKKAAACSRQLECEDPKVLELGQVASLDPEYLMLCGHVGCEARHNEGSTLEPSLR